MAAVAAAVAVIALDKLTHFVAALALLAAVMVAAAVVVVALSLGMVALVVMAHKALLFLFMRLRHQSRRYCLRLRT